MILRPFLSSRPRARATCSAVSSQSALAVVDPHVELVDAIWSAAERVGAPIVAVFETHVQADHVSGLPELVEATGATAYLPAGAGVEFEHVRSPTARWWSSGTRSCARWRRPGTRRHIPPTGRRPAPRRPRSPGSSSPATRCSSATSAAGPARQRRPRAARTAADASMRGCSSCPTTCSSTRATSAAPSAAAALSGNPFSSIGFERRHNQALAHDDADGVRPGAARRRAAAAGRPGGDRRRQPRGPRAPPA